MALAWFICPYKRRDLRGQPGRYVAMDDFTVQIAADGGTWQETEILGPGIGQALVKVRASSGTLAAIQATPGFFRLPDGALDLSLSGLSAAQKLGLGTLLQAAGYSAAEILSSLGADLGASTLGDVLRFFASRRRRERYDPASASIVCDGPAASCVPVDEVDLKAR